MEIRARAVTYCSRNFLGILLRRSRVLGFVARFLPPVLKEGGEFSPSAGDGRAARVHGRA